MSVKISRIYVLCKSRNIMLRWTSVGDRLQTEGRVESFSAVIDALTLQQSIKHLQKILKCLS